MWDRISSWLGVGSSDERSGATSATSPSSSRSSSRSRSPSGTRSHARSTSGSANISSSAGSFFNSMMPGHGPDSVTLKYGTNHYHLKFCQDDFDGETDPSAGVTLRSLQFLVSRLLTPKVMADSSETSSTAAAVRKLYKNKDANGVVQIDSAQLAAASGNSRPLDINKFSLIHTGKKLDEASKSLKAYGVKTGDLITVYVSKPEAMSAAAAANDRARKAAGGKKGKKGKKQAGGNVWPANNNSTGTTSQIPRKFPEPTKPVALKTEREKVADVVNYVNENILPLIEKFESNTPTDKGQRLDDHRIISESILQKMLVLDGIDTSQEDDREVTEGTVPLRQVRKEAVNKMHAYLKRADDAYKTE